MTPDYSKVAREKAHKCIDGIAFAFFGEFNVGPVDLENRIERELIQSYQDGRREGMQMCVDACQSPTAKGRILALIKELE